MGKQMGVQPTHHTLPNSGHKVATACLVLGPAAFLLLLFVPLPNLASSHDTVTTTLELRATLGLVAWMAIWWMSEALPLAATSLLPLAILPAFGVIRAQDVAGNYFQDIIVLFFGGFCLALAMEKCGLHKRIALRVVRIFGTKPRNLIFGFLASSALLSMWVSNTATALMLLPVAVTVASQLIDKPVEERNVIERHFAAACVLAVALGASLGGFGTIIGTPPNAYLQSYYNDRFSAEILERAMPEITFGNWMIFAVPAVIVLVPLTWLVLTRLSFRIPRELGSANTTKLLEELREKQPMSAAQKFVVGIFTTTALMWVTHKAIVIGGSTLPLTGWDEHFRFVKAGKPFITDGTIAAAASLLLFALPTFKNKGDRLLTWDFAKTRLPWGVLLLFGGGLALAAGLDQSGANTYLMAAFESMQGISLWVLVLLIITIMAAISELASNTAAATMVVPVLASLALALDQNPLILLLAGTLGASCGYALPVATPPNAVAFGSGEVSVRDMVRCGIVIDVLAIIVLFALVMFVAPLIF